MDKMRKKAEETFRNAWPYENDPKHPAWQKAVGVIESALRLVRDEAMEEAADLVAQGGTVNFDEFAYEYAKAIRALKLPGGEA